FGRRAGHFLLRHQASLQIDDNFKECRALTHFEAPMLTTIGDFNFRYCDALTNFKAPELVLLGDDNFIKCDALTRFEAPELITIGDYNFRACDVLTEVQFGQYQYAVKSADGLLTIIEKSKTVNGIEIHSGYIFNDCNEGVPDLSETFLVEKDGFFAHSKKIEKAMEALEFKRAAKP
ncbi:MAG: hypothetical protein E2604_10355, partial [Flavobacterium sp.]|nr:hypothetical protein [Flavobacterium sp.]